MILAVEFDDDVTPHEVQQRAFELIALWRKPVKIVFGSGDALRFDENGGSLATRAPMTTRKKRR
jgi:hypothetical protein